MTNFLFICQILISISLCLTADTAKPFNSNDYVLKPKFKTFSCACNDLIFCYVKR